MEKTDKTLSDAQLIERTIDFAGDLQKQVYDLQTALSDSQKECEILMKALELSCSIPATNPYATFNNVAWWANIFINKAKQDLGEGKE